MKSHFATISAWQPHKQRYWVRVPLSGITSGTIPDEMTNNCISVQEGELVQDESRFQIDFS
jgi:hypothetical protein